MCHLCVKVRGGHIWNDINKHWSHSSGVFHTGLNGFTCAWQKLLQVEQCFLGSYITQPKSTMCDFQPKKHGPIGIIHLIAGYVAGKRYITRRNSQGRTRSSLTDCSNKKQNPGSWHRNAVSKLCRWVSSSHCITPTHSRRNKTYSTQPVLSGAPSGSHSTNEDNPTLSGAEVKIIIRQQKKIPNRPK